jgi:hypothetical protein
MFHVVLEKQICYIACDKFQFISFMCRDKEEGEMKPKAEEGGATLSVGELNGDTDKAKPGET